MVRGEIDNQYSGWDDPIVVLRDAVRRSTGRVEENRDEWASWLHDRGLDTIWAPRLSIEDSSTVITVIEDSYNYESPPPLVFGEIRDPHAGTPLLLSSEGGRFWTVSDARVTGGWDVVRTADGACWPALTSSTESLLLSNALDARLIGWTHSFMILRDDAEVARSRIWRGKRTGTSRGASRRIDTAIALVGEHSTQYGHWLTDYLSRALSVRSLPTATRVLIDEGVPENALWWLHKVLPERPIMRLKAGESVDVGTLIVPLQRTFCPTGWIDSMELTPDIWSSDSNAVMQIQSLATRDTALANRHRKIWLGRRDHGLNKPLLNQQKLFDRMVGHGFEMVYPEDLSMSQLQRLLGETKNIIAPLGSHLLNLLAARPGLRVLVLLGDVIMQVRGGVANYASACGHDVALVGGTEVGPLGRNPYERKQRAYVVDPDLLEVAQSAFFGDSGR